MLVARTGSNVTLPCLGLTGVAHSDVARLTWLCYGCLESVVVAALDASLETPLVEFSDGVTTVLHQRGRVRLVPETFALLYEPVLVRHSGRYLCRVNGKSSEHANIELVVQGERRGVPHPSPLPSPPPPLRCLDDVCTYAVPLCSSSPTRSLLGAVLEAGVIGVVFVSCERALECALRRAWVQPALRIS